MEPLTTFKKSLSTLTTETLFLLRDPNGERFSSTRIHEKLNEGCLDFCLKTQLIKEEINCIMSENQFEIDVKKLVEDGPSLRYYAFPIRVGYDGADGTGIVPGSLLAIDIKGYTRSESMMPSIWYLCAVSPGKIQILGPMQAAGDASPSEGGNIQVTYIAMPTPMSETTDYPDEIPSYFHKYLPYGAAAVILEEGDKDDLALSDYYESEFQRGILEQVAESYRGNTPYEDCRPM